MTTFTIENTQFGEKAFKTLKTLKGADSRKLDFVVVRRAGIKSELESTREAAFKITGDLEEVIQGLEEEGHEVEVNL